jgi:hypothetical protein
MDALEASHGTVYREPEGRVALAGAIVETSRLYSAIYCTWVGCMIRWVGDTVGALSCFDGKRFVVCPIHLCMPLAPTITPDVVFRAYCIHQKQSEYSRQTGPAS